MQTRPADQSNGSRFVQRAESVGRWSAVALGATIPISTALNNILVPVFALAWLASGGYGVKGRQITGTPVALVAIVLFALILLGVTWAGNTADDSWSMVSKYRDLLLVGLFLWAFREPRIRAAGLVGFAIAMVVTLVVSCLTFVEILPPAVFLGGQAKNPLIYTSSNAMVFKHQVTHSFLMSIAAFLFALAAYHARDRRWKIAGAVLAGLATANVLLMVQGRTGYLVLAALIVYLFAIRFHWKGLVVAAVLVSATGAAAYTLSDTFRSRVALTVQQAQAFDPSKPADETSSIGLRLEYYTNSLAIVRDHPLAGVGTGGFADAYAKQVEGTGRIATKNPHNEYLMIGVQLGVLGIAALLALFAVHWVSAARLASPFETQLARGLVLAVAVGCLVNALLLDHTEGLLYAWLTGLLFGGYRPAERA